VEYPVRHMGQAGAGSSSRDRRYQQNRQIYKEMISVEKLIYVKLRWNMEFIRDDDWAIKMFFFIP